jgi:hypothetical protein
MRLNPGARISLAILAPVLVCVMLAGGEWARETVSSPPDGSMASMATPPVVKPQQTSAARTHVREVQQALLNAGYDPGPIDGILGPRTKSALRKYIAVPPPQVPADVDQAIGRLRVDERREGP